MKWIASIGLALIVAACSSGSVRDATKAEVTSALQHCGIKVQDVRAGDRGQTAWVWYWHHDGTVNDDTMYCVRDRLAEQHVKADIYDSTIAGKVPN